MVLALRTVMPRSAHGQEKAPRQPRTALLLIDFMIFIFYNELNIYFVKTIRFVSIIFPSTYKE